MDTTHKAWPGIGFVAVVLGAYVAGWGAHQAAWYGSPTEFVGAFVVFCGLILHLVAFCHADWK